MQVGDAAHPNVRDELVVALDLRPRQYLLDDETASAPAAPRSCGEAHAVDQRLEIVIAGEEIEPDLGRRLRVGALMRTVRGRRAADAPATT